ncbi:MAG: methylated-DNA--[protein]-cysteine S-methyltransferase [Bacteroidales bacterium]|jgi:methylated-DNA-[protein]-cysteine S-methyltransferase
MEKTYFLAPIGLLEISGSEKGIASVSFVANVDNVIENPPCLRECVSQLNDYFNGKRKSFNLKLDVEGTEFQKKVWNELLKIPYGKTVTYNDIAKKLGDKEAVRAVGHANGKNPIAIIIPCHRVIGSDGKLVGYAGGLWRKKWLLNFEQKDVQGELF